MLGMKSCRRILNQRRDRDWGIVQTALLPNLVKHVEGEAVNEAV